MSTNLTTESSVISSMIKQYQDAQATAVAKEKAERDAAIAEAVKNCRAAFATIIDELQVPGDEQSDMITAHLDNKQLVGISMPARLQGWEPVYQFYLCWKGGALLASNTQYFGHHAFGVRFAEDNETAVAKFLAEQQEEYQRVLDRHNATKWQEVTQATNALSHRLAPGRASHNDDLTSADGALARLIALNPAREADWRDLHARYMEAYHTAVADHEAAQAELKQKVAQAIQYHLAYRAHVDACEAVDQKNAAAVAEIQKQYGGNFVLYDLEYAVAARDDEDGEVYVETETAKVLHPVPDSGGWYTTVNSSGRVERKRFFHLVSVSDAKIHSTGDRVYAGRVNHDGHTVYFPPDASGQTVDEVLAKMKAALASSPDEPSLKGYSLPNDYHLFNRLRGAEPLSEEEIARYF